MEQLFHIHSIGFEQEKELLDQDDGVQSRENETIGPNKNNSFACSCYIFWRSNSLHLLEMSAKPYSIGGCGHISEWLNRVL